MKTGFVYHHRVAFHETDAMGVVHHSNHIKYFEEARVHWLRERGLVALHIPVGPFVFAIVDVKCTYLKTARFEDALEVWVEARLVGARLQLQYAIWNQRTAEWIATGLTDLVPLTKDDLVPARLPRDARAVFSDEPWSESWPPAHP